MISNVPVTNYPFLPFSACGGHLTESSGTILSPGYPANYPHNQICSWVISIPSGNTITFLPSTIDIEQHSSCAFDYLEVSFRWTNSVQFKANLMLFNVRRMNRPVSLHIFAFLIYLKHAFVRNVV